MTKLLQVVMGVILGIVLLTTHAEAGTVEISTDEYTVIHSGLFHDVYDVQLSTSIGDPDRYVKLFALLGSLQGDDVVYLHLAGNGGYASTAMQFVNILHHTKAKTIAIVEGPVYSAHAYIAIAAQKIVVDPSTLFLFHRSSLYGHEEEACAGQDGDNDRGQDAGVKCRAFVKDLMEQDRAFVVRELSSILTPQELQGVLNGDDYTITGDELMKRLVANGDARAH